MDKKEIEAILNTLTTRQRQAVYCIYRDVVDRYNTAAREGVMKAIHHERVMLDTDVGVLLLAPQVPEEPPCIRPH